MVLRLQRGDLAAREGLPHTCRRGRVQAGTILLALVALGLIGLTGWQVLRPLALAEAQLAEERHDDLNAVRLALDHLQRFPHSAQAARIAARALSRLNYPDLAEPYYQRARQAGVLGVDDLRARALALAQRNRLEEAEASYKEIIDRAPADAQALRQYAALLMLQRRYRDALKLARRLTESPSQAEVGYSLIGTVEHEQRHPDRAVAAFEHVLQLDPDLRHLSLPRPMFWQYLAENLIDSGQAAKAERYMRHELQFARNPAQMDLLGLALQWKGSMTEAEQCYRTALAWDPRLASAWLHLGRLLLQPEQNRTEEAIECLKQAAQRAPQSFEAPYSLGLAYRRLGKKAEAAKYQQLAEELRRAHPAPGTGMNAMPGSPP